MQKVNLSIVSLALSQYNNGNKTQAIERIMAQCEHLPSGSGLDNGVRFSYSKSKPNQLVFKTSFHHINENGFYTCWTQHKIIVKPSFFQGFEVTITGRNKNGIKEYLYDLFIDVFAIDHN